MTRHEEFDRFAADYRRIHSDNVRISGVDSAYFCEHKILEIKRLEPNPAIRLLDFGCGDGALADPFLAHFPQGRYTGIDVSGQSIRVARCRNLQDCCFLHYDGWQAPLTEASFDVAVAANVFHHIPHRDHGRHLGQIARLLKPGGRIYIFEHNPLNPATRYIVTTCVFDKNAVLVRPGSLKTALAATGFAGLSLRYLLFFPRLRLFGRLMAWENRLADWPLGAQYMVRGVSAT